MKKIILSVAITVLGTYMAKAQNEGYDSLSIRPVHNSDIMYKKTVTRALDLREKQNLPMFSKNREITGLIVNAVLKGDLKAYTNDSLNAQIAITDFEEKLLSPEAKNMPTDTFELFTLYGENWREVVANMMNSKYAGRDLYQLEMKEDVIFDKQRSRMYYDIKTITVFIPADHPLNITGIQMPVATFSYKDLVQNVFKDNSKAIWFNVQNDKEHKNLADAFELRLFSSYLIKVSNPSDAYLTDIYGGDQLKGIMASQWAAHEMLEYEHNLWEF
jgi:gliding motility associated protien GldN